jgi:DNA-directed RNA polymerase subunit RPC12/RpoP
MKAYKDGEYIKYQQDIHHPFHKELETFEVYECNVCKGHFFVESEAIENLEEITCPYCGPYCDCGK